MPRFGQVLLGINHHLLFPEAQLDPVLHLNTLRDVILPLRDFQVVDCLLPADESCRSAEVRAIARSGKSVVYNCPLFALTTGLDPSSPDPSMHREAIARARQHVGWAKGLPTLGVVVASGPDPGPGMREEHFAAFVDFLVELAQEAHPLPLLLEPFDRTVDKCFLVGPTLDAVSVVTRVRALGGGNMHLMADMGHLPLMGESFAHALALSRPFLRHVHLGNCVLRDPSHPLAGDKHPPLGIPGGENGPRQLAQFLLELQRIGYLGGEIAAHPTVTLEQRPYPGKTARESIGIWLDMLRKAWPA